LIDRVFPLLVFLCITWKPKKPTLQNTAIIANVNKCTKTTSGSQRHCVT